MACTLNHALYHRALADAKAGRANHGKWSAPADASRNDRNSIGQDGGTWKYPIYTTAGELSAKGVGDALGYAEANNEHELIGPLREISEAIKQHAEQHLSAESDFDVIALSAGDEDGHWITLEDGRHVFIGSPGPGASAESKQRFHETHAARHARLAEKAKANGDHDAHIRHEVAARVHGDMAKGKDAREPEPSVSNARYADGMKAVRPASIDGYKGRGSRLAEALNGRWSNREHAYIMSPTKAKKLVSLFHSGHDAGFFDKTIKHAGELSATGVPLIYLHCPTGGAFELASNLPADLPREIAGEPVEYMWKDLIHTGEYVHPIKRFHLSISGAKLDTLERNFREMKRRGVEVPINVDHSEAADDNRGFLVDVKRTNGTLMGLCQFIGKDAARTAARNRVSAGIDPDYTDGTGHKYGDAIRHVALTPVPVVPDQQPFTIAASRAAAGGDVLTLAAADPDPNAPHGARSEPMAHKMLQCSEESLNAMHRHVPGLGAAGDDEKLSRVAQHVGTTHGHLKNLMQCLGMDADGDMPAMLSRAVEALKSRNAQDVEDAGGATAVANLSVAQIADKARERRKGAFEAIAESSRLRERLEEKDRQIQSLSAATVKPLDPENQASVLESAAVLAESLVAKGAVNPITKDRLLSLAKSGEKVNTLLLSSAANPAGSGPAILALLRALADNQRPALGEKTGLQALSRAIPGEEVASLPVDKFNAFIGEGKEIKTAL